MPKMSKGRGEELSFFRSPEGRIKINPQCRMCNQFCKQSYTFVLERASGNT